jgi:hypothetical protein
MIDTKKIKKLGVPNPEAGGIEAYGGRRKIYTPILHITKKIHFLKGD